MYQIDFNSPIKVHFIGIGGISMSGLAEVLLSRGFKISGSDNQASPLTEALIAAGATVEIGQRASNITDDIDLVVYTAAIKDGNPEFEACKAKNLPMLTRAELLGQMMKNYDSPIAISGTHGKTTTTSMMSEILLAEDTDPTLSIGGILKTIGGNIRVGHSEYFVTEACEYTNSFLSFFPKYSIILNIEEDHLDFFKDLDDIRNSFHKFAALLPADGGLLINSAIENHAEIYRDIAAKAYTFGLKETDDYFATDITFDEFGAGNFTFNTKSGKKLSVTLSLLGIHNVLNATAALGMADILGLDLEVAATSLKKCTGADRRFEHKGELGGITIIDDYAHHPTEIQATLNSAAVYPHKHLWVVFQPHTYTRTKALMDDFAKVLATAENVILADIYAARETDTLGVSSKMLAEKINEMGGNATHFSTFSEIEINLLKNLSAGDLLITMGAGDVYKIGENLLGR